VSRFRSAIVIQTQIDQPCLLGQVKQRDQRWKVK